MTLLRFWRILIGSSLFYPYTAYACTGDSILNAAGEVFLQNFDSSLNATLPSNFCGKYISSTDSLFVSWAVAHSNQLWARNEFIAVLDGQWESGLIPSIRFGLNDDSTWINDTFFPGALFWNGTSESGLNTSTLAAFPLHAHVALQIYLLSDQDADAELWLNIIFPKLFRYHQYLHNIRAYQNTNLVFILHPWESTLALNAESWTGDCLAEAQDSKNNDPTYIPPIVAESIRLRTDYPGDEVFNTELFLVGFLGAWGALNGSEIAPSDPPYSPFKMLDVEFNAVLMLSDAALLSLMNILNDARHSWQKSVITKDELDELYLWNKLQSDSSSMPLENIWVENEQGGSFLNHYISNSESAPIAMLPIPSGVFSAWNLNSISIDYTVELIKLFIGGGLSGAWGASFRCDGLQYPIPQESCTTSDSSQNRVVGLIENVMAQRGALYQGYVGISEYLVNTTLELMCSGCDNATCVFDHWYNVADGLPMDSGRISSLSAAVAVILIRADVPQGTTAYPPISHAFMFGIMISELIFAFAVGLSCFILSLQLIRKLHGEEQTPLGTLLGSPLRRGYVGIPPDSSISSNDEEPNTVTQFNLETFSRSDRSKNDPIDEQEREENPAVSNVSEDEESDVVSSLYHSAIQYLKFWG